MLANRTDAGPPHSGRKALIVDDEAAMRAALSESLRRLGFAVDLAVDGQDALDCLGNSKPWLVLTDMKMPRLGGIAFVKELHRRLPEAHIVVMTAFGSVETAVEAMKVGARDFLLKPFAAEAIDRVVCALNEPRAVPAGTGAPSLAAARPILTEDPGMLRLIGMADTVAASQATVMIYGESGTGKEVLARFIHAKSPRAHRPLIAVNCAALPDGLLESELFGYERGAFTGAMMRKIGKFEAANCGTLLLDEISEMNLGLQAKLLRVIQEREVDRVGGNAPIPVNIRVIATTNRSLHREVEHGRFREDLYYRLNVFPVTVPPLRERPGDIPLLAQHFVQATASRNGMPVPVLSRGALDCLVQRFWKGNVRELENAVERAVLLAAGGEIVAGHFEESPMAVAAGSPAPSVSESRVAPSNGSLWEMERELIFTTLARVNQNRTHAARALGISVRTLRNKLHEYRQTGSPARAA